MSCFEKTIGVFCLFSLLSFENKNVQTTNLNVQNICDINYTMHIGLFHLNKNHLNLEVQVCIWAPIFLCILIMEIMWCVGVLENEQMITLWCVIIFHMIFYVFMHTHVLQVSLCTHICCHILWHVWQGKVSDHKWTYGQVWAQVHAVSYTHLTLPTILLV